MRRFPPIAAVALALTLAASAAPAQALVPADVSLTFDMPSSVQSVSPDVYYDAGSGTYYLYTTGMRIGVYSSTDGKSWAAVTDASTPMGTYFDPSVIAMPDGSYRMYYVYRASMGGPQCEGKQLKYATSTDLIRWTAQSPVLLADLGCGVPNVVRTGDEYRLYYVRGDGSFAHGTYMATSPDGLTWTPTDTMVTPADMVDPSVVHLSDGRWLMFTADFPPHDSDGGSKSRSLLPSASEPFLQKLYVGTSADGREWDFGDEVALYAAPSGQGAFDPDAVVLPDGSVRIWWSQGTSPFTAVVVSGTVAVAAGPAAPGKPRVATGKSGVKVSWTYPDGVPAPQGYRVQVKSAKSWKDVARTTATTASIAWSKVGVKKGKSFQVRVRAFIDSSTSTSEATRATRPR